LFHLVLVHSDPRLVRLDEQTELADQIRIPLTYTGYVSQRIGNDGTDRGKVNPEGRDIVVVSSGGTGKTELLSCAIEAWNFLAAQKLVRNYTLEVFLPLAARPEEVRNLQRQAGGSSIHLRPYSIDFLNWMQAAELSISHAGYNTCTNILETGIRSILIPNLQMSDQPLRARRFAERGFATLIDPSELTSQWLAQAIQQQLNSPKPRHDVNLNGAEMTLHLLEGLYVKPSTMPEMDETVPTIRAA
jgi:predicted glycosyltransferase